MSVARADRPPNFRSLAKRIDNIAHREARPVRRIQRAVANTVIGQMLPAGVVKGGTAMKLRVGEDASRFTPDLDAARSADLSLVAYLDELEDRLAAGWGGFTGTLRPLPAPQPESVPKDYVMQPFEIRLAYGGNHWLPVMFELGRDEIGSTSRHDLRLADDIVALFAELGLDRPAPIPLLTVDHQIAQKLHACTSINEKTGGNERAHDLVDLQIILDEEEIDLAAVAVTARRLFVSRRGHAWPPTVVAYDGWGSFYAKAAEGVGVIESVADAVTWANDLIARIDS